MRRPDDDGLDEAMRLLGDSIEEWSKSLSSDSFEPPAVVGRLQERCDRILWLMKSRVISSFPLDIRRTWFRAASAIIFRVDQAVDARRQFLHPMATERRRRFMMMLIEQRLGEAHELAQRLAAELERDRIFAGGPTQRERPYASSIRALQRVSTFLGHPERWCKNTEARDKRGKPIDWSSGRAMSFSLVGAIRATCQDLSEQDKRFVFAAVGDAASRSTLKEIQEWNDKLGTSHEDVMALLARATKALERNELRRQHDFDL